MVYGMDAPDNIRSFVYVGNRCEIIECIFQTQSRGILLANDVPLSTIRLILRIAKAKNKKIYFLYVKMFGRLLRWLNLSIYQHLFESLEIDNTQTKHVLDFKNPYSVEDRIRIMIQGENK